MIKKTTYRTYLQLSMKICWWWYSQKNTIHNYFALWSVWKWLDVFLGLRIASCESDGNIRCDFAQLRFNCSAPCTLYGRMFRRRPPAALSVYVCVCRSNCTAATDFLWPAQSSHLASWVLEMYVWVSVRDRVEAAPMQASAFIFAGDRVNVCVCSSVCVCVQYDYKHQRRMRECTGGICGNGKTTTTHGDAAGVWCQCTPFTVRVWWWACTATDARPSRVRTMPCGPGYRRRRTGKESKNPIAP